MKSKNFIWIFAEKKKDRVNLELRTDLSKNDVSQILLLASEMIHTKFKTCHNGAKFIIPIETGNFTFQKTQEGK